ncbi:uncharacterized protein SPPG_04407 [Spizellomyces punctatus DAOM BR117]|uniref:adenylate cyclase n=2 Tax=Spizellomyces punctatus (strain DAOM BR117) TaxID=645134 RepID=A0A0L0HGT0_SPIPD|nr:uncharacterized protein SPPG_04407 [Spizellomyces punctatus DAOM BR117]KND00065.1 hypothetical protein SPPG_04407 [Spizellomyces punctatus DAOM BR117]|eukprot:XP_016608104.1 hypothetical protein SPPG_04407 [Spizellomyces punctatus DAOM BR117]
MRYRHRLRAWWERLVYELTTTDTIQHVPRQRTGHSPAASAKGNLNAIPGAAKPKDNIPKIRIKASQVSPVDVNDDSSAKSVEQGSNADANLTDANVTFLDVTSLESDRSLLRRYMNPFTLHFHHTRTEEHYFRTQLLPNRVLHLRLLAFLQLLQYTGIMFPTYRTEYAKFERNGQRFTRGFILLWVIYTLSWMFILFATVWKRGKVYIWLSLRSKTWRIALTALETFAVCAGAAWDFYLAPDAADPVGPVSTISILYFTISSGFAATYLQGVAGLFAVSILCTVKLAFVALAHGAYPAVIYAVPFLITAIVSYGLVVAGDRKRRIGYIKCQVVEDRLAQMRLERMKTDYLLSLSLPKSIVAKLRESGIGRSDLIAERFPQASVMFCDLKNFKEVASTLGSTKDALALLNGIFQHVDEAIEDYSDVTKIKTISTKILLVGGLHRSNTHLRQMLDLALTLRDYFNNPQLYDIGDERISIKLDIEFGVALGPLVAGIVGRKKFVYEIYGDVVNTASRMCSLAHEQEIIVTENVQQKIVGVFETVSLGTRPVKGKGVIPIYSVTGPVETAELSASRRYSRKSSFTPSALEGLASRFGSVARIDTAIVSSAYARAPLSSDVEDSVSGQLPTVSEEGGVETRSGFGFPNSTGHAGTSKILLDRYLSVGSAGLALGGGMDAHHPAKVAMGVATLGSPLTVAKTGRTNVSHVEREFGTLTAKPHSEPTREAEPHEPSILATMREVASPSNVKPAAEDETGHNPEAKEVLVDVVQRMCAKIDISTATGLSYMNIVYNEFDPLGVRFKHPLIENRFRGDFTADTRGPFVRAGSIVLLCEILFYFMGIYNAIKNGVQLVDTPETYYLILGCGVASVGLQLLVTGVSVFAVAETSAPSRRFVPRQIIFWIYVCTIWITIICITLPWSQLGHYDFMTGCVIPHIAFFFCMRIEGMIFLWRTIAASLVGPTVVIMQLALGQAVWQEAACMVLSGCTWVAIFYLMEKRRRVDYLIDLILDTQGELVADEINKSAAVLHSILPQAVILKLLEDPTSIVYEEMDMVTVLHMDIAGFTAMSSNLEPLTIVKMLNTLFTYFDHLTEEYGVEKITTIGDAYVACSSLTTSAEPKTGALSICLVALQMQAYVEQQLNTSAIVMQIIKSPLKMRIGIHTGQACGAIMGGPKNFRYDVIGDTVVIAEKTQERCPVGDVSITASTYACVKDYHGFSFIPQKSDGLPSSQRSYVLKASDERIVSTTADYDNPPTTPTQGSKASFSAGTSRPSSGALGMALRTGPISGLGRGAPLLGRPPSRQSFSMRKGSIVPEEINGLEGMRSSNTGSFVKNFFGKTEEQDENEGLDLESRGVKQDLGQ